MTDRVGRQKDFMPPKTNGSGRLRLFGWPKIIGFSILILAVMVLLYPRDDLIQQIERSSGKDPLSRKYLDSLLRSDPLNPALLARKAEMLIASGKEAEAEQLLLELSRQTDPALKLRVAEAMITLREQQTFAHPPGSSKRNQRLAALHQALSMLADQPLEPQAREDLAKKAIAYGANDLAIRLYRSLAATADPPAALAWIEKAARLTLSMGRYRETAALYFSARSLSAGQAGSGQAQQVEYFLAGVGALQAGNLPDEALEAAERELGDLSSEPDVLLFMVRLARAANRLDRAEVYVRKLLHHASLAPSSLEGPAGIRLVSRPAFAPQAVRSDTQEAFRRLPLCANDHASVSCWQRLPGSTSVFLPTGFVKVGNSPRLPFDDEIYTLGYDIFLANRNIREAYVVAEAAVQQAPRSVAWRERLARVAEWHGQPTVALEQWKYLALNHDSEQAWQNLLRLAPGLFDEETVVMALTREHRLGRLDDVRLLRLVDAFEAMGEPRKGVEFLQLAYRNQPRRALLERKAWLQGRMGLTREATASLRLLDEKHGLAQNEALTLASLLITQGKFDEAYRELQRHDTEASRNNRNYQALMADLAWRLQDHAQARRLYQGLQATGTLADHETERLVLLLQDDNPDAAAVLAAQHWKQRRVYRFLQIAVDLHIRSGNLPAARELLAGLSPAETSRFEQRPDFLLMRANLHRQGGALSPAVADIRRAVEIQPGNVSLSAQLIWVLIEARDQTALHAELLQRHPRALNEPLLWGPMGAGFALLSRAQLALPYYAKQASARRQDYLWQVGYAQVLEATGHADMAWRIRRHAWNSLRRGDPPSPARREQWQALAQLALRMAPGDASAHWLRESLRLDRGGDGQLLSESKELATAFYLSNEQYDAARIWLAQQYGKQLQAPGWTGAALALQSRDKAALEKIIEGKNDGIEPATRVDAALQLRRYDIARKLAEAGLDIDPGNPTLHLQLTESVWQRQNRANLVGRRENVGNLESTSWQAGGQWHVTPNLRMELTLSQADLSSRDPSRLSHLPGQDRRFALSGTLMREKSETSVRLRYRDALDKFVGLELGHQLRIDRRLRVGGALGYNQDADENDVLLGGGMKDTLKLNAEWLISRREYLLAELFAARYHGQDRHYLGQGTGLALQLGHRFRTEYPDATVKLLGNIYRFDESRAAGGSILSLVPPGAGLLPGNLSQIGIGIGLGETAAGQFSRALRPFAALDLLYDTSGGLGYSLETGFVFSPTGHDWLRGRYRTGRGGLGFSEANHLIEFEYRYLF